MASRDIRHRLGNDRGTELKVQKIIDEILDRGGYRLMVDNLHSEVDDEELDSLFGIIGHLESATVFYDRSGRSQGSGEVIFSWVVDAFKAIRAFNGAPFWGQVLRISCGGRVSPERLDLIKSKRKPGKSQHSPKERRKVEREFSPPRETRRVTEKDKREEVEKSERDYCISILIKKLSERERSLAKNFKRNTERNHPSSMQSPREMDCSPSRKTERLRIRKRQYSPDRGDYRKQSAEKHLSPLREIRKQVTEREHSPPKEIRKQVTEREYSPPKDIRQIPTLPHKSPVETQERAQTPSQISVVYTRKVNYFPVAVSSEPRIPFEVEVVPPSAPKNMFKKKPMAERLYYQPRSRFVWKRQDVVVTKSVVTKMDLDNDIDAYMEQRNKR